MPSKFLIDKLAASGLLPEDIDATDVVSPFGQGTAIRIPYYDTDGRQHTHMHRVRLENPAPGQGKYSQPSTKELVAAGHPDHTATHPYLNPHILGGWTWAQVGAYKPKRVLLVEGELKAAAAGKHLGLAAIGIPGCEGGVRRVEWGVARVHPVIAGLLQPGDSVDVVLDGDIHTNKDVNRAGGTLRRALMRLGVRVVFVLLPEPVAGRGAGLDDWLMGMDAADRASAYAALPRVDGAEFRECVISAADYFELATSPKGLALPTVGNIVRIFEHHERFVTRYHFDVMRGNLYQGDRPFSASFIFDEQHWFEAQLGMKIGSQVMRESLGWLAAQPRWRRNTLLESIPTWDGVNRMETMFTQGWGATDCGHVRACGRNWLVSLIARASVPGCKVDTMIVLVGKQGIGKSKSLEAIAGDLYVTVHAQVKDKDFTLALHRGAVIDMAELSSMNHADANNIKGILSTAIDHIRPPYGVSVEQMPRHSIMVGTTNEERFLRDPTGNRRFWPIACGKINMDWIAANRMQLLAEALERYNVGQTWWEMPDETELVQLSRMEVSPWDEPLERILSQVHNFRVISVQGFTYRFVTSDELLGFMDIEVKHRKSHMYRDLAAAMDRIGGGWEGYFCAQRIVLTGGGYLERARGYRIPTTGNPTATVIELHPQPPGPAGF